MDTIFFPFVDYWWFYAGFITFILALLALDLGVFHRKSHTVSFREAAAWTVVWISLALLFNLLFYYYVKFKFPMELGLAKQLALEFLTGFVVEKSLAVDNIFVFVVVFSYFHIPMHLQHRVLFFGILGALVFRGIFIALGSYLMAFEWVVIAFGLLLIATGIKMVFSPEKPVEPEKNFAIRALKKIMPVTLTIEGQSFFVKHNGVWHMTPLLVALVFLELTDILFAVDSVPAIFALTKEPLIVFTSNIFAILGLRSMYFMLGGVMDRFIYLKFGLAAVLVFVGLKMTYLNHLFGGKFPIGLSLGLIFLFIGTSIVVSMVATAKKNGSEL